MASRPTRNSPPETAVWQKLVRRRKRTRRRRKEEEKEEEEEEKEKVEEEIRPLAKGYYVTERNGNLCA